MLTNSQKRELKSLAHHLKPVVQIGQKGITENLLKAINQALDDHELIKIKFIDFKDQKDIIMGNILEEIECELVGKIGNIIILFRYNNNDDTRQYSI